MKLLCVHISKRCIDTNHHPHNANNTYLFGHTFLLDLWRQTSFFCAMRCFEDA